MKAILLVHDDLDFIITFGELLNNCGYTVIPKVSCEDALSIIKEGVRIDLVMLGYKESCDDRGFLAGLRELVPSVPFIVLATGATAASFLNLLNCEGNLKRRKPVGTWTGKEEMQAEGKRGIRNNQSADDLLSPIHNVR